MKTTRRTAFGAGVRLLLALAALAAGQSTAARAEPAAPRAAVVRTLAAPRAEALPLRSAEKRLVHRAATPSASRSAPDAPPLGATADASDPPLPLYLAHRALLI